MTNRLYPGLAFMALLLAGCPTRTIYYDAGADHPNVEKGGASGHGAGAGAAGTNAIGGAGGHSSGGIAASGDGGAAGQDSGGAAGQGSAGTVGQGTGGTAGDGKGGGAGQDQGGNGGSGGVSNEGGAAGVGQSGGAGGANSCGKSCNGGSCQAGQCQPLLLAQYTGAAELIDIGATSVYVSTDLGYIGKAAKDGSDLKAPQMPSFVTSARIGTHAIEDGDRVFFVWWGGSAYQVSFCSSQSGETTIMPVGGSATQYFAVDKANHRIGWIDYSPTRILVGSTTGTITGTQILAMDGSWSEQPLYSAAGGLFLVGSTGTIQRLPLSGGAFRTVASGAGNGNVTILGDNGTNLYFYDGASIRFTPLPAGDGLIGQKLIDTSLSPATARRFAVDAQTAYWISSGKIHTCELAQCDATEQIVASQASVQVEDVGIDGNALYWANAVEGNVPGSGLSYFSVWKLAR